MYSWAQENFKNKGGNLNDIQKKNFKGEKGVYEEIIIIY